MKKILSLSLATILAGSVSMGIAGAAEKVKIGVVIYNYNDNFMSFVKKSVEKAFAQKGNVDVTFVDAQNDQAVLNDKVDNLIAQKVKALAINLVDPGAGKAVLEKAKAAGIPVVFFNKEPSAKVLTENKNTYYVGTTSSESGALQGQLIADQFAAKLIKDNNGDGKIGYIMLKGEPGHPDAEARTKESVNVAKSKGVPLDKVGEEAAFWDTAQAKDKCDALIASNGKKIDVVIANNDGMALGCIASMKERNVKIPLYGVDGLPDAVVAINNGELNGTILNDPKNQGQATADLTYNLAMGNDALKDTKWKLDSVNAVRVPYVIVTKDNIQMAKEAFAK